ncbi:MAG: FixG Ig-like domain-containing protein, partial [Candidatus Competibacterales bacterium]|nr:FixG Ig-like domain-containing protein [Candidatus Competibacterales bacterium]
ALYRIEDPRKIENSYTLRVINRTEQAREFRISATGLDDLKIESEVAFRLAPGEVGSIPTTLSVPRGSVQGGQDIVVTVTATDDLAVTASHASRFFGPVGGSR